MKVLGLPCSECMVALPCLINKELNEIQHGPGGLPGGVVRGVAAGGACAVKVLEVLVMCNCCRSGCYVAAGGVSAV